MAPESMVSAGMGAMNSVLGKLSALLEAESTKQKKAGKDVLLLLDELSSMKLVLEKYARMEDPDAQVEAWAREVRELTYDLEDRVDAFMSPAHRKSVEPTGIMGLVHSLKRLISHDSIAHGIKGLKNLVLEVSSRRPADRCSMSVIDAPKVDLGAPTNRTVCVGMDGPRDKVIKLLMEEAHILKVVSIVGMGGVGKTALTEQVLDQINDQFQCTARECMSQRPDMKRVLTSILSQLGVQDDKLEDVQQLIDKTRHSLMDKRYLIVVDDMWHIPAWQLLKYALPNNNRCSRVIITTRVMAVAESCSTGKDYIYRMEPLNYLNSKRLFFEISFGSEYGCLPQLREVSNAIIQICAGLPLAIVCIAGLLRTKPLEQWEEIKDSLVSACADSLGDVKKIILLSYRDLPPQLQSCLLYLSIFPEDYAAERDQIVWKWIAEGFITSELGLCMEEQGNRYFSELVERSLIQPVDIQYDGTAQRCRVHDLILDFITDLSVKENFTTILYEQEPLFCTTSSSAAQAVKKIRRLSILSDNAAQAVMQPSIASSIRSFSQHCFLKRLPHFLDFRALRVLDLECCRCLMNHHIDNIGSLFQLRYLSLAYTDITELPEQIGDLPHLETLDLRWCSIKKLPTAAVRLHKLERLLVDEGVALPDDIGKMEALQLLSSVSMSSIKLVEELGRLTQLRTLKINYGMVDDVRSCRNALATSLRELGRQALRSLEIDAEEQSLPDSLLEQCYTFPHIQKLVISKYITRVPKWITSMVKLAHLELKVVTIKEEDIFALQTVPTLLYLQIELQNASDEMLVISSKGFSYLIEFRFICWNCRMGLTFTAFAMPVLRKCYLCFGALKTMSKWGSIDLGVEHLLHLQHLDVTIDCRGATNRDVEAVEASIKRAAGTHPNQLMLQSRRWYEADIVVDEETDELEGSEELEVHETDGSY